MRVRQNNKQHSKNIKSNKVFKKILRSTQNTIQITHNSKSIKTKKTKKNL